MFLKKKNNKLDMLVGSNSEIKGDISTQGTVRIDGKLTGKITADLVIIGKQGFVAGHITARRVVIGGHLDGNANGDEDVKIEPTGKLFGDIYTRKLSIVSGSLFEGKSYILKDETKVIDFLDKEAVSK